MKTHPVVENICVFADPYRTFAVALIAPSKLLLETMASNIGKELPYEALLRDVDVQQHILKILIDHGMKNRLQKFEIPNAVTLVQEEWTPESGLITASFKVKRKMIQNVYQIEIDRMYEEKEGEIVRE
jgi:long-chain acyl-CoA synthetase